MGEAEDDVKCDAFLDAPDDDDESVGTDGGSRSSDISASSPPRSACLAAKPTPEYSEQIIWNRLCSGHRTYITEELYEPTGCQDATG